MKIWLPVLFFLTAACLGSIRDKHKPRVVLSWHEKVNRAGVMIRDLGLDVLVEPPGSLPYSSNASAAVWLGVNFPVDQLADVMDIGRTYYPDLRYVALSDYGLDSPPAQVHDEVYIGGSTETALKLGLKAWTDQDFRKLRTLKTKEEVAAFVRSKYGPRRSMK